MAQSNGPVHALLRFSVPDYSIPPEDRSLFALPASTEVKEEKLMLHDFRTDPDVIRGPEGLDAQGFTYIKHRSALSDDERWFTGQHVEDVYLPEVEALVCKVTGAKKAIVNNVAFRRKLAERQADFKHYLKRGCPLDKELGKIPADKPMVYGKEEGGSLEPARLAHIDYTVEGLRRTARYCRSDITAAAQEALDAEDANAKATNGEHVQTPRYAAFSVWRPVKTVRRDPLAVCDWRSLDKKELVNSEYRAKSEVNKSGEYMMEASSLLPPKNPGQQKWYWMPEQQPDEVLILKFADTAAEGNPEIAGASVHCSPIVLGTEDEETRLSIEARVLAFW